MSRQRSIRIKTEVIKAIEEMAKDENRTFNNMVETILIKEINKTKDNE